MIVMQIKQKDKYAAKDLQKNAAFLWKNNRWLGNLSYSCVSIAFRFSSSVTLLITCAASA